MKRIMKKILVFALVLTMVASNSLTAFATENTDGNTEENVCTGSEDCTATEHVENCASAIDEVQEAEKEEDNTTTEESQPDNGGIMLASVDDANESSGANDDGSNTESEEFVAKIGENSYATLKEAVEAANDMTDTPEVTIGIYGKAEYTADTENLTGAYSKINFVGQTDDAEISITRDGSGGYISGENSTKTVNFTDLTLSKPSGAFANDAGFMNVYFTVYRVTEVNYTNCTFPDGACAQGDKATYTNCEFANQTSGEYSLWVYANVDCTVTNSTFTGVRGVKMYAEGAAKTSDLTLSRVEFKESVTEKPAIVLTYGESVTLSGNTYPAKGVFELDADGEPNGTTVTADIKDIACTSDGYADCGVLVDGKIYTTITDAAAAATEGSTVTLYYDSEETVELPVGVTLNKNGNAAEGVTVASSTKINLNEDAAAIEKTGEYIVTGSGSNNLTVKSDATIVLDNVNIEADADKSAISIESGNVTLIIKGDVNLTGGDNDAGIYVAEDASVTIKKFGTETDKLTAIGNAGTDDASGAAGIGGTYVNGNSGTITIDGATVTAKGYGAHGSGIGSGFGGVSGKINIINDAEVTAYGGYYSEGGKLQTSYGSGDPEGSAAIGGGAKTNATIKPIKISDSTVTAYGGSKAAGIGAAFWASCELIDIDDSTITAYGGSSSAGIGTSRAGSNGVSVVIEITNSTVNATGGEYGSGIGGGYNGDSLANLPETTIEIDGGETVATGGNGGAGIGGGYKTNNLNIDITGNAKVTATAGELVAGKTIAQGGASSAIGSGANGSGTFVGSDVNVAGNATITTVAYAGTGAKSAIEATNTAGTPNGIDLTSDNITVYDKDNNVIEYVAQNETTGAYYTTLEDAVSSAENNETIIVLTDISGEAVSVEKSITIKGDVTLNNVSITANGENIDLTVEGLSFTGNSWIDSENAKSLTVTGVEANVTPSNANATNSRSAFIALGSSEQKTLELTVTDSKFVVSGGGDAILGWAAITDATISGNTFGSADNYIENADAVKFMGIADGAEITVSDNTVYSNYNGFVFGQNTTRDNAYTVIVEDNDFYGTADHIWVEVTGANTTHATVEATSDNTVNGEVFTVDDIKYSSGITTWISYAGVDVLTDANGKVFGGTLGKFSNQEVIAQGYKMDENGNVVVKATVKVATYDELVSALEDGGPIELTADITVDKAIKVLDGTTIDMNGHTIYLNVENNHFGNAIIKNEAADGGFVLGKDDVHVCDGYFLVDAGKTLNMSGLNVTSSEDGIKGYAVFHLKEGADLILDDCAIDIANNEYAGSIFYAGNTNSEIKLNDTEVTGENVGRGFVYGDVTMNNSNVTLKGTTENGLEHGFNGSNLEVNDSNITISGGTGRGITLGRSESTNMTVNGNSTITITDMEEATIKLSQSTDTLTVVKPAIIKLDKAVTNTVGGTVVGKEYIKIIGETDNQSKPAGGSSGSSNSNKDSDKKNESNEPVEVYHAATQSSKVAETGDASNAMLWISIMGIAVIAVVAVSAMKKKSLK